MIRSTAAILLVFSSIAGAQSGHLHIGQDPPDLAVTLLDSSLPAAWKGSNMRDTVFILDFWATWCAPCTASIPHMDSLIEAFRGKNVKFLSITYEPEEKVRMFLRDHPMRSTVALDTGFTMFRVYNAWAIPNIVVINVKGKIAGRIYPVRLTEAGITQLLEGMVPDVQNTPENLFEPGGAENYFRSLLIKKQ